MHTPGKASEIILFYPRDESLLLKKKNLPFLTPFQRTIHEINIKPAIFPKDEKSSLSSIRNNWFVNLSTLDILYDIQCLFQLGQNFSLSSNNCKKNIIELIKIVENNIKKLNIIKQTLEICPYPSYTIFIPPTKIEITRLMKN